MLGARHPRLAIFALLAIALQAFQQRHRTTHFAIHREFAHAREPHHLAGRHGANHGIALIATRSQRGQDGQKMLFHKQHGGDQDIALLYVFDAAL